MRLWKESRRQRRVVEALRAAGAAGMSPLALAVTTQLPEPELRAAVRQLVADGVVTEWSDPRPSGLLPRGGYRLAAPRHRHA